MSDQIIRLYPCESDRRNLSTLRVDTVQEPNPTNYRKVVVNKPWGYEYLMFENESVAVWILFLKKGHTTSMHCHPQKKTSLVVIDGTVTCSTLEGWHDRAVLQSLIIERGIFHSTEATSTRGAIIMEVETPPIKSDLARLKDNYGRAGQAYEGVDKMSLNLRQYDYIDFHNSSRKKPATRQLKTCIFSLLSSQSYLSNLNHPSDLKNSLLCLLQGQVTNQTGATVVDVGEIMRYDELVSHSKVTMSKDVEFLVIGKS